VSKAEHDFRAARTREATPRYDRAWYESAAGALNRHGLHGLRCLDLCCGNAEFSEILRDRFGMRVTCADYAPAHLKRARSLGFDALETDLDAAAADVDRAVEPVRGAFDLVVSLATIEHVFDSDNVFRLVHRALKPGGLFLVNTPNIAFFAYRLYAAFSGNRPFDEGHHVRFWSFRFLRTNLFLNGFDVVADERRYHVLPDVVFDRALRGRAWLGRPLTAAFQACRLLQHLPFGRDGFTDQLTVLARRSDTPPIGFGAAAAERHLAGLADPADRARAVERIRAAHRLGWLGEFPLLRAFARDLA
jgi:SAM-dependent methyltransferase